MSNTSQFLQPQQAQQQQQLQQAQNEQSKLNETLLNFSSILSNLNNQSRLTSGGAGQPKPYGQGTSKRAIARRRAKEQSNQSGTVNNSRVSKGNRSNQQQNRGNVKPINEDRIVSRIVNQLKPKLTIDESTIAKSDGTVNSSTMEWLQSQLNDSPDTKPIEDSNPLKLYTRDIPHEMMDPNYSTVGSKIALYRSLVFPEYGEPGKLPGAELSITGKYWKSLTLTPSVNGYVFVIVNPRNFNAASGAVFIGASIGDISVMTFTNMNGAGGANTNSVYQDGTQLEAARVTGCSMIARCVNPTNQNASGIMATSYQPKIWKNAAGTNFTSNVSQRDIEQAVSKFNGQIGGLNDIVKAVWLPRDTNEMNYAQSGHAEENTSFLALCISATNPNTVFRVDIYINYEFQPGENLEDIIGDSNPPDNLDSTAYGEVIAKANVMLKKDYKDQDANYNPWYKKVVHSIGNNLGGVVKAANLVSPYLPGLFPKATTLANLILNGSVKY